MRYPVYAPIAAQGVVEARGWTFSAGGGDSVSAVRGGWQNAQTPEGAFVFAHRRDVGEGRFFAFRKSFKAGGV